MRTIIPGFRSGGEHLPLRVLGRILLRLFDPKLNESSDTNKIKLTEEIKSNRVAAAAVK